MKKFLSTIAFAGTLALFATPTFAASVGVGTGLYGSDSSNSTSGSASANANLQVGEGILTASSTGNADLGTSAAGSNASATGSEMRAENSAVGSMLTITADDAASGATLSSSTQVASDSDFTAYARGAMKSDAAIQEVDADDSSVTVKYHERGSFLGLFPLTMTSSAAISDNGSVSVAHPWYYFLTTTGTDNAALKAALSTEAASTFNTRPSNASEGATSTASGSAALSASEKAQLLADINLALASALGTSAGANTSATGSAGY